MEIETHIDAVDAISHLSDEVSFIAGLLADSSGGTSWSTNGLCFLLQRFAADLTAIEKVLNDAYLRESIDTVMDREAKKR
ncbi:MAG: hypothetical protein K9L82_07080 [Chromatiaceae bacterium]|nr:hypothetical protein [Chromatiaceae bacterium]MCF7996754.1 hypothetical protein [Chromatiaceae bacterium]